MPLDSYFRNSSLAFPGQPCRVHPLNSRTLELKLPERRIRRDEEFWLPVFVWQVCAVGNTAMVILGSVGNQVLYWFL